MRRLTTFMLVSLAIAGCGSRQGAASPGETPIPPRVSAPATLLPDGTVPWVDEKAGEREIQVPNPVQPGRRDAPACKAGQLTVSMKDWQQLPTTDSETGKGIPGAGMIGTVQARNSSGSDCTLQGEVPARLLVEGQVQPLGYSHTVNDAARQRVTPVGTGASAELRLDWSAPYCGSRTGTQQVELTLPHNGGTLRVPVRRPRWPNCTRSELHPELASYLSSGAFDVPGFTPPMNSPLNKLKVKLEPGRPARAGQRYIYRIDVINPTGTAVPLNPCPGYSQERFSMGDADHQAVNDFTLYRLNCRPVHQVPAHGQIRFEMVTQIPSGITGRSFAVTWKMHARNVNAGLWAETHFTVL
jgi:hypothetical protein